MLSAVSVQHSAKGRGHIRNGSPSLKADCLTWTAERKQRRRVMRISGVGCALVESIILGGVNRIAIKAQALIPILGRNSVSQYQHTQN